MPTSISHMAAAFVLQRCSRWIKCILCPLGSRLLVKKWIEAKHDRWEQQHVLGRAAGRLPSGMLYKCAGMAARRKASKGCSAFNGAHVQGHGVWHGVIEQRWRNKERGAGRCSAKRH